MKGLRMKTIGLLGGMSWESTALYYRLINDAVNRRLGGLHSARMVMVSVDFEPIEAMQRAEDWEAAGTALAEAARQVQQYREAVDFYRESVQSEIEKFRLGVSTLIDTIFTEQNQISAELALIDSQQRYAELLAQLRFESATLLEEQPEGWVVEEENLRTLPAVGGQ
jgi:hypothetical protein